MTCTFIAMIGFSQPIVVENLTYEQCDKAHVELLHALRPCPRLRIGVHFTSFTVPPEVDRAK